MIEITINNNLDIKNSYIEKIKSIAYILDKFIKEYENLNFKVNIVITNNNGIKDINSKFRNINETTDVLSFPMLENYNGKLSYEQYEIEPEKNELFLGDIIISYERAIEQASEYNHSYEREVAFLLTHGMLHLLGYDHDTISRERKMREKQEILLELEGYSR